MPNIILTNNCNQKCPYCFAAGVMEQSRNNNEMTLRDLNTVLDFLAVSSNRNARFMGGEPTLHSQFEKVIDHTLARNFRVHIFTNGIISSTRINFLKNLGKTMKYSFNINPPEMYSAGAWDSVLHSLYVLAPLSNILLGGVIFQSDFNINHLLSLACRHKIKTIMLRIANPIIRGNNIFMPPRQYQILAKSIIAAVKKADKYGVRVGFGCGFPGKMFNKTQLAIFKKYQVANIKWGCQGNSGRFDIAPDLSVFRCFPLSNWQRKKLTDFKDCQAVENYFNNIMERYQSRNSENDFINQGPCFSYLLTETNK